MSWAIEKIQYSIHLHHHKFCFYFIRIDLNRKRGSLRTSKDDNLKRPFQKKRNPQKLFDPAVIRELGERGEKVFVKWRVSETNCNKITSQQHNQ